MITIKTELRTEQGSSAAGRLRRAGSIPGVLTRLNGDILLIKTNAHAYMMASRKQETATVGGFALELDGATVIATLCEAQYDVMTGETSHLDLKEVK